MTSCSSRGSAVTKAKSSVLPRIGGLFAGFSNLAAIARAAILVLAIGAMGRASAVTSLQTTVSGGSFTINDENSEDFDNCTQTVSSPTLTIPASTDLPSGTKVAISEISIGKRGDGTGTYSDKIRIIVGTETYTSASKTEDDSVTFTCTTTSETSVKQTYSFADTGCILEVGTTYTIAFLDSSGNEMTGNALNTRVAKNTDSLFGATVQWGATWRPVQEIKGDIIYTCTVASDGSATWDITPPSSSTLRYWFEVAESASFNIGTLSCKQAYFNIGDNQTLSLSGSVTASSGIYVYGGEIAVTAAPTFNGTVKGDGTLYYNGVRPTTSGSDVILTDSDWCGTVRITYNKENTATGGARQLFPQHWGSTNSKIKWNGVAGYFGGCTSTAGWILEDLTVNATTYPALRKNDGGSSALTKAPSLEGDGEFCDASNPTERFHFVDGSNFEGKITITSNAGYGMNVQFGVTALDKQARTIDVLSGASVTVASGKTWSAPGGIVVSGTLTLEDSTSALSGTVSGSGKIVCDGFLPSLTGLTASGWTGTVSIAADGVSGTEWTTEAIMNSGSTIEIAEGMLKVSDVSNLTGSFKIDSGAYLWVTDTTSTSASIKISDWSGTLYVQRPNALTSLQVDIGTIRSVANGNVMLNNASLPVELTLAEVKGEGGSIDLSNLAAFTGRASTTYKVRRVDGVTVDATLDDGTLTYTPAISGAATDIDWDFTDGTDDALEQAPTGVSKNYDSTATFYVDAEDSSYTGVYLKHHPYVTGAANFIHNNSSAITVAAVGTMPEGEKTIFMNFGSAYASKYGLLLANTTVANEVLVAYNYGATVTPITTMTVPNATTARHSYIITKEDGASSTTFTVYLDGIKWKTVTTDFKIEFSDSNTGIQFGSDFGGNIRNAGYPAVDKDTGTGILNVLRVYGRIITPAEIATYASTYPYVSPSGSSSRTFAASAENWIDTTESSTSWDNSSEEDSGTPTEGASVSVTATADTVITVNLSDETEYEALTINGSSVTFAPASASSGAIKVTGMTVIGTTVVNQYGAVDMTGGPMTLTEDGDVTFDYSAYDASAIYTTTDIPLTSDVDEDNTKVHLTAPTTPYRTYSLVYTSGHYAMRVTPDHEAGSNVYFASGYLDGTMTGSDGQGTVYLETGHSNQTILFPGDTMVIDDNSSLWENQVWVSDEFIGNIKVARTTAMTLHNGELTDPILVGKTITVDEGASLTISKHSSQALTLGALTINGAGDVTLSGPLTLGGAVAGTATVTVDGTVTVASTGSIANTITGAGVLAYTVLPESALSFSDWTGTVQLPAITTGGINFNNYGVAGSTVYLTSMSGAWIDPDNTTIAPKLYLAGNMTLTAMSTRTYTFAEIDGAGDLSFATGEGDPVVVITKVAEGYLGTISSSLDNKVTITTLARPATDTSVDSTKLLDTGSAANKFTVGTVTINGVETTLNLRYDANGIYSVLIPADDGYMAGTMAVVTNTTDTVTIPASATSLATVMASNTATFNYSGTGITAENVDDFGKVFVYATDANGELMVMQQLPAAYFTRTVSGGKITIALDENAVRPTVKADAEVPMALDTTTQAPKFAITPIVGFWYAVSYSTDGSTFYTDTAEGSLKQAQNNSELTLEGGEASAPGDGATYYKVKLGVSKAALVSDAAPAVEE